MAAGSTGTTRPSAAPTDPARDALRNAGLALLFLCAFGSTPLPAQTTPSSAHDTVSPIADALCRDMRSTKVLNPGAPAGCERLRLVRFSYLGFDGATHDDGELVVLDAVADHVLAIFVALRVRAFPIASAKLMNHYRGSDDASMARNNTSAFNVRRVERRARGIEVSPPAGSGYVRRQDQRPGMAEAVVDVFAHHGFAQWGGYWPRGIDYQHFQVGRRLAAQLVALPFPKARAAFEQHVERVRACMQAARQKGQRSLGACAG